MRLVLISDTHGKHEQLGTLSRDILIHCGDFCHGYDNDGADVSAIDRWFSKQDFQRILCIGGNHDFLAQERRANGDAVFENAIFLQDQAFVFGGVRFYGAPWLPDLAGWAYYLPDRERQSKWQRIPQNTDVLITHSPPFGILDKPRTGRSIGCAFLRSIIDQLALKVHCFGHVHASAGQVVEPGVSFVNASVIDSDYDVCHGPTVMEIQIESNGGVYAAPANAI